MTLSPDERIAQLMIVRLSSFNVSRKETIFHDSVVLDLVKKYNIGGICLFQGGPAKQAMLMNNIQANAKTPILVSMDAEWGVGMRILDSVMPLPKQMMLGAVRDAALIKQYGSVVARQLQRLGVHVNYAPVADVNNNPDNPVINDRSFGEDKHKVAAYAIQYMRGLQDNNIMACAKHFPGHGDVSVDSHLDLPVVEKSRQQLDTLELAPFKKLFKAQIGSAMIAHLYMPAIDSAANAPTSLSSKAIKGLLRNELNYDGLVFTDALEMQGVKKFFEAGEISVQAIIAGNDMLCLPENVPLAIQKINEAITSGRLLRTEVDERCRKVLIAKHRYLVANRKTIVVENIQSDLNREIPLMRRLIAENAITLLSNQDSALFPLTGDTLSTAYVSIGTITENNIARRMRQEVNARVYQFDYRKKNDDSVRMLLDSIVLNHRRIVIGIHGFARQPANNFGISAQAVNFVNELQRRARCMTLVFGNAYAAKNWCSARNLAVCYEDDSIVQDVAFELINGKGEFQGALPVSVCDEYRFGYGLTLVKRELKSANPVHAGFHTSITAAIDSIAVDAINRKATPGCVVLVAKDGVIVHEKAYGHFTYEKLQPVQTTTAYDLASLTKILSTTIALMKLVDEQKISLKDSISKFLPWLAGSNKASLTLESLLLHEAGLEASLPFYKRTLDRNSRPLPPYYRTEFSDSFSIEVAENLFLQTNFKEAMQQMIISSALRPGKYVYSDLDFILLGQVAEAVTGKSLDEYTRQNFYQPMGLTSVVFNPVNHVPANGIAPTVDEQGFRQQLLQGYVHDQAAALMGGVSGHAGLFGNAADVAALMQMLLNGGKYLGKEYLKKETVDLFTAYHSPMSRRGYGFDKPEFDSAQKKDPYPTLSASPKSFGHTGFTGTSAWADPQTNLIYIFLSNRIHPVENKRLLNMNVRPKIHEEIYRSLNPANTSR